MTSEKNVLDQEAVVHRTFRIEPLSDKALQAATEGLRSLPGIHSVEIPETGQTGLRLSYDTRQWNAGQIIEQLLAMGIRPAASLWQRVRLALLRLQDENIRDNMTHKPHCCSRPPPGAGKGLGGSGH